MPDSEALLDRLTNSVVDGVAVDWHSVETAQLTAEERVWVGRLRTLARLAEEHARAVDPPRGDVERAAAPVPRGELRSESTETRMERWGELTLVEKLGEGAAGETFRAWDPELGREIALKVIARGKCRAFPVEEARLLARVRHPNVVTIFGLDRIDDRVALRMELVRGRTLEQILSEHGPLGAQEAAVIGMALSRALAAVHRAGVIHRDLKTTNVMREEGGRIVLLDFSAGVDQAAWDQTIDSVTGTPLYMAPEVLRGEPPTPQSDVYSLAVLLFRLVTFSFPVEAKTVGELMDVHARRQGRRLRDVRADLQEAFVQVVERALAPEPERRHHTAGDLHADLSSAAGLPANQGPDTTEPPGRIASRRTFQWAASFVAVLAALAIWSGLASRARQTSPPDGLPAPGKGSPVSTGTASGGDAPSGARVDGRSGKPADEQRKLVESLLSLADLHLAMGSYDEAKPLYERALALQEASPGPTQLEIAQTLSGLGWVLEVLGSYGEARTRLERALSLYETEVGRDSPQVASVLSSLGALRQRMGAYQEATPLLERARVIRDKEARQKKASQMVSLGQLAKANGSSVFTVEATLHRMNNDLRESLTSGSRVAPGDELCLELRASESLYVYVLNQDERGEAYLLAPLPGFDAVNPLAAGVTHRLPGARRGSEQFWQVTSTGGREHLLVVASPTRLIEFETEIESLPVPTAARAISAAALSEDTVHRLRGIGGLVNRKARGDNTTTVWLFEGARELGSALESVQGVWIRRLDLENP